MNHRQFRSLAHLYTLCFDFGHCVLHGVIATMIDVENVSVFLDHSIIIIKIWLSRPTISHVVMILGLRVNLSHVLLSAIIFIKRFGSAFLGGWTIDMILHFWMVIELLDNHSFMVLYLRSRIGMRQSTSWLISIWAILI